MPLLCVPIIIVHVQKFHGDSTIIYSIEEDDEDILTMTAIIGDIYFTKGVSSFCSLQLNFCQRYLQNIFTSRRCGCLASVQKEDKWRLEGGGAPRKKSKLRFLNKSISFYIFLLFRFITFLSFLFLMHHQRKSKLSLLKNASLYAVREKGKIQKVEKEKEDEWGLQRGGASRAL